MASKNTDARTATGPSFERILRTRDPFAIQGEIAARLEAGRRDRLDVDREALAADRKDLETALKYLDGRVPPARLPRLTGLIALIADQQKEVDATLSALRDPPVIPVGGWLVLGRVREADGAPPQGGQIEFEGGGDIAGKLLPPIGIPADGQVRVALSAEAVAEITCQGDVSVKVVATVGGRRAEDVAPARIAAGGLHQFDLVLPVPAGTRPTGR